jgi:hypothetical protein
MSESHPKDLSARLDLLNRAIEKAERSLSQINVCVAGSVDLYPDKPDSLDRLGYGKIRSTWHLYVDLRGTQHLLTNASQEVRLQAANRLGDLFSTLLNETNSRADAIEMATKNFEAFAEKVMSTKEE